VIAIVGSYLRHSRVGVLPNTSWFRDTLQIATTPRPLHLCCQPLESREGDTAHEPKTRSNKPAPQFTQIWKRYQLSKFPKPPDLAFFLAGSAPSSSSSATYFPVLESVAAFRYLPTPPGDSF